MRIAFLLAALAGLAATAGAAHADSLGRPCTDKPESEYLNLDSLKAKIVEQGYQIRSGEIRLTCGEFYVLDQNGTRAELFVDPTSGKIVAGDGKGDAATSGEDGNAGKIAAGDSDDRREGGKRDGDD
jgi:hypothetical protein